MNEELLKRFDALAAKLGTTGEQLWAILVQQAKVEAVFSLAAAILLTIGAGLLVHAGRKLWNHDDDLVGPAIFSFGIAALLLLPIGYNLFEVRWYFMPEAWALREILSALK